MTNGTVEFLRQEIDRTRVEEGTVVTFDRTLHNNQYDRRQELSPIVEEGKVITYAAIFVAGHWFFTGQGHLGREKLRTRDFIERVSQDDISNIKVATSFDALFPETTSDDVEA